MISKLTVLILSSLFYTTAGNAALKVMTTTETLKAVTQEIGGSKVDVGSFSRGSQDPHFLEAKPSFMMKTNRANLVIAIGLDLEVAWLPKVLSGARNPDVIKGKKGYLEVGPSLEVLEIPTGPVTRADGDIHPEGNPHVDLDPVRLGEIGGLIAKRLSLLDPANESLYNENSQAFKTRMETKTKAWRSRIAASGIKKVVTYHKSLSYFLDRFDVRSAAMLEPLPGVPPTAAHILSVIKETSRAGVKLTMVENIFDDSIALRVAKEVPGMRVVRVPVAVGGRKDIRSPDDLFEALTKSFEGNQ